MINDISDLINIKNTHGDEEFTKTGDNLVWDADGADIYYQGESQKELPIECSVKYELDGEEVLAKDLAGKSGKVKIIVKYTNKDEHIVNIQGKDTKLYTPFVVVCGTILDNTIHKNIEVSNGKIVNDGNKTFVLGMAFPGLKESLDVSSDKVDFPDTVEITMESDKFEIGNIASFITPKVLEEEDLSVFDDLDEVYDKVNTLESSSKELEDGVNTLKSGVDTFYEKSQEFNSAMKEVSSGANTIYKSYSELDDGINTLYDGTEELKDGAKKLSDGSKDLNAGLKTASDEAKELSAGAKKLAGSINSISESMPSGLTPSDIGETIGKLKANIAEIDAQIKQLKGTNTQITALQNKINAQIENLTEAQEDLADEETLATQTKKETVPNVDVADTITNQNAELIKSLEQTKLVYQNLIALLQNQQILGNSNIQVLMSYLTQSLPQLSAGANTLSTGAENLSAGLSKLSAGASELASGTNDLYVGTETLQDGAKALSEGSKEMKDGLKTLDSGTSELANANDQLTDGAGTISDGAKTLKDGVSRFNKEGIEKVCGYINGDVKTVTERVEKLKDLANEYKTFTMLNKDTEGSVKFIMLMDGISVKDMQKEEIILNQDKDTKKDN